MGEPVLLVTVDVGDHKDMMGLFHVRKKELPAARMVASEKHEVTTATQTPNAVYIYLPCTHSSDGTRIWCLSVSRARLRLLCLLTAAP